MIRACSRSVHPKPRARVARTGPHWTRAARHPGIESGHTSFRRAEAIAKGRPCAGYRAIDTRAAKPACGPGPGLPFRSESRRRTRARLGQGSGRESAEKPIREKGCEQGWPEVVGQVDYHRAWARSSVRAVVAGARLDPGLFARDADR